MQNRSYYEAYDERYRTVHEKGMHWFSDRGSPIVADMVEKYHIPKSARILEIGCGEGRDAGALLKQGYCLLATDISGEAIRYCRERFWEHAESFRVLDCLTERLPERFDFIYAVALLHMLVMDDDRRAFYRFIRRHLAKEGIALVCTMGDGKTKRQSDPGAAFSLQERECAGKRLLVAATSCRMVDDEAFAAELDQGGLQVVEKGQTSIPPDFSDMMYALVRRKS